MAGDLGRFKSTLIYEKQAPADELAADLQLVRDFDKQSEGKVKRYKTITLVSVLVVIGSIVLGILTHSPFCAIALLVGVIGIIVGAVLWSMGAKFDLVNKRYELFGAMARLLSRDMPKDAPIAATLDLARPNLKRKRTTEGQAGPWKVTYYVDPWLKLSGRFADGTSFQLTVIEKFQARGKWKRSRSGKNKYKTKTKSSTQACVRLFPKGKRYDNLAQVASQAPNMIKLPPWVGIKNVEGTTEELSLTTYTLEDWTVGNLDPKSRYDAVEMMATMLLSLYQVLHASTATARS